MIATLTGFAPAVPIIATTTKSPLLYRPYVEATTIAQAIVCPDFAQLVNRPALHSAVSPACMALLHAIATNPDAARLYPYWWCTDGTQRQLVTTALDLTVHDLTLHSVTTLIDLVRGDLHDTLHDDQQVREVAA